MEPEKIKIYANAVKCAVFHCGAMRNDGVSFSEIPRRDAGKDGSNDLLAMLKVRQRAVWETALRKVVNLEAMIHNQFICSRHFIKGKKARITESNDPDWVPTLNLEPPGSTKDQQQHPSQQVQCKASVSAGRPSGEDITAQKNKKMGNYESYALIEGRIKYNYLFRKRSQREKAWRAVQRNCTPLLNCYTVDYMERKWIKLCQTYKRFTGPRDPKAPDYFPAEEWVHYSKMHNAMAQMNAPSQELTTAEEAQEPEEDEETEVHVDDYYDDGNSRILWAKGSENRPRPSRTAQMARPAAKRPVSSGARICKAIQSGNPGLQPTARPVPPAGATDYCRLCFTNQELEPLCSGVIVVRDELLEKIYVCTGVLIIARPKESVYICNPCAALINNFSTFRQQICSNNRALLDHLKGKNAPEVFDPSEPMLSQPPLVGTAVSSVLSQAHIVRGPAPKRVILTPAGKTLPIRANTPVLVRAPQPVQVVGTPRLPTLTRAPQAPVVVKRIVYAKGTVPPVKRIVYAKSAPPPAPPTPSSDEAAMDIPEEIKTEFDDPLEGVGDSGNALVMPKPIKTTGAPPPTTLKMRVESHPEPTASGEESWKCWHCGQNYSFKFECAKHLLQVHQEGVPNIRNRLDLDELNSNMLEMMSIRGGGKPPPVKRARVDSSSSDVELCE